MAEKKQDLPDFIVDMTKKLIRPPLLHGCGYSESDINQPMIGIANTWTELNPVLGDVVDYRDKLVFWIERYDRFWEVKTQNHKTGDTRHSGKNIMRLKNL